MRTPICDLIGINVPIFAFSHCRNVVAEISRAGGFGVLGTSRFTPEQLEIELSWLDKETKGNPYGVDLIFQFGIEELSVDEFRKKLPLEHRKFVADLINRFEIPSSKGMSEEQFGLGTNLYMSTQHARKSVEVALRHRIKLIASALGPLPNDIVRIAKEKNILVAGLVGRPEHVIHHIKNGTDIIVATGSEAGGHCGEIGSMVLVPQIVAVAENLPVLAAGGISTGNQIVASLALGAQGVWTGSVWLPTFESDIHPIVKEKLIQAKSTDSIRSSCITGKPSRQLKTPWIEAWENTDAPKPLPSPLQGILTSGVLIGAYENEIQDLMGTPVGQGVGLLNSMDRVRDVMYRMFEEYYESSERIGILFRKSDQ
ncbi:MAG: nitronate monooxygenase [Betaproteobacteria bacterium]